MASIEEMNIEVDEKNILRIIKRIKGNRHRACYQNILEFARREDKNLDREKIKVIIDKLIERRVIIDINIKKNIPDMESFKIVGDNLEAEMQTNIQDEVDENMTSLENFINHKFHETLINKIRDEVKTVINTESSLLNTNLNVNGFKVINPECDCDNNRKHSSDLINVLLDQIDFLKGELKSKDSIIKILLNDRVSDTSLNSKLKDPTINKDMTRINNSVKNSYSYRSGFFSDNNNNININKENNANDLENDNDDGLQGEFKEVKRNNNKRSVTIIGDSIVKDVKSYKMRNALPNKENVYVKSFPGATVECMKSYIKPSLKFNPNVIIINTGTNDLRSNKLPDQIADDIINLALSVKSDHTEIAISGIVPRNDALYIKGHAVNNYLKQKLPQHNIAYINNDNINPKMHLNNSRLHLNSNGTTLLARNFIDFIML